MDVEKLNIAFVGGGNMAEALIKGLVQRMPADQIHVVEVLEERRTFLSSTYGVQVAEAASDRLGEVDVLILAVKPQQLLEVMATLTAYMHPERTLVVSIAAGILTKQIEQTAGDQVRVVRVMPNTPALIGAGASAVCRGAQATAEDIECTRALLEAVGLVVEVAEKEMDAVTALSGSGPAYVFYLFEAMLAAAARLKLDDTQARALVQATVEGAARLVKETGLSPDELRRRVTSKGGTTERAIHELDQRQVREHIVAAVRAAHDRSRELSSGTKNA